MPAELDAYINSYNFCFSDLMRSMGEAGLEEGEHFDLRCVCGVRCLYFQFD